MVFSSHVFLFYFLPLTLIGYYIMVAMRLNRSWLNMFLTVVSYVFYGWFQPYFVLLMWFTSFINYLAGKYISEPGASKRQRDTALMLSMIISLSMLGFFKYYMFFMGGVNRLAELFGAGSSFFHVMQVTLPIGISFYTFHALSYTIDVYRGDAPPVKDLKTITCFISIFSQLVAGPIIRYNTVADQLANRKHSLAQFGSGVALFMLGFAKKILLANTCGDLASTVFRADSPDTIAAWWGIIAYHFQIYFDFCAYSDMAVGLGRMIGFEFIKNFNGPYWSTSISEFWTRWHISLSSWIRDYLYVGLGGNRKGPRRTYINLGISMFLSGLWHGAQMTFVIWGTFQAAFMMWERTLGRKTIYQKTPFIVQVIITNVIVMFSWVVFRAPSFDQAVDYWRTMLGFGHVATATTDLLKAQIFSLKYVIQIALCTILVWQPIQAHAWVNKLTPARFVLLALLFVYAISVMFTQSFNPFIYYQF
ncbi:MAG: MBOAT family protein [Chitinivibrionales bacterium]|nr:MBOAT family protein [Chitinivibrionales bacterium]